MFEIVFFSLSPQGVVKIKSVAFLRADKKGILMFNTLSYLYSIQDLDLLQFCSNTISGFRKVVLLEFESSATTLFDLYICLVYG